MNEYWFPWRRMVRHGVITLALTAAAALALILLVPACDVPGSSATDAHADAGDVDVDVTPAEQPYAVAQALVAAKPDPIPPVIGGPNDWAVCNWYYQRCARYCTYSPFVFLCLDQCYRQFLICMGQVGP